MSRKSAQKIRGQAIGEIGAARYARLEAVGLLVVDAEEQRALLAELGKLRAQLRQMGQALAGGAEAQAELAACILQQAMR